MHGQELLRRNNSYNSDADARSDTNDSQKPLTRPPIQRQPNFKLLSFNTTAMTDRRSASAKVINNADLLAHIASFMHFSSDPEQKAADDGYCE